jgi:class 3 adenylate cyclase
MTRLPHTLVTSTESALCLELHPWAVLDTLQDSIAVVDSEGQFRYVNDAWQRAFPSNYETSDPTNRTNYLWIFSRLACEYEDTRTIARGLSSILYGRRSQFSIECCLHTYTDSYARATDEQHWFEITMTPYPVDSAIGAIIQARDITSQRAQAEANRVLQQQVEELQSDKADLEVLLETTTEHSDLMEKEEHSRLTSDLESALNQQVALTSAYSRFVPRQILTFLGKETITEVALGDHVQREMTVLFSDIRSFTTLSEQMTPQENFNFINEYLRQVSPIIRRHSGFIDKYIGDAIMALFPGRDVPGEANDAIDAAIEMQHAVTEYNAHRATKGYPPISIGIGLHTGKLMLGTVGEPERMEGTVISDAVNLASRMEGLTRMYGASVVVSERTLFSTDDLIQYQFRFLDKVKVKGRRLPVSVFEILNGYPPELFELKLTTQQDFERGLLHYHSEEFAEAVERFKKILTIDSSDNAARLYLQRATYFLEHGVPPGWEGIESLSEK